VPTSRANREQVRCQNQRCPTAPSGGRILFERAAGFWFKEQGKTRMAALGAPIVVTCESCGEQWTNKEILLFDGIAQIMQDTIAQAADKVRADIGDDELPPRPGKLRRVV
jgi:hypothetical protein